MHKANLISDQEIDSITVDSYEVGILNKTYAFPMYDIDNDINNYYDIDCSIMINEYGDPIHTRVTNKENWPIHDKNYQGVIEEIVKESFDSLSNDQKQRIQNAILSQSVRFVR